MVYLSKRSSRVQNSIERYSASAAKAKGPMKQNLKCGRTTSDTTSQPIQFAKCKVSQIGAEFDQSITFEEWADIGRRAVKAAESVQWVIGDWMNFGEDKFIAPVEQQTGNRYQLALNTLPYQYGTLANLKAISKAIPVSRRREKLSFGHHAEVAWLKDSKAQDKYLKIAEAEGLSIVALRSLIRSREAEIHESTEVAPDQTLTQWTRRIRMMIQREDISSWSNERRQATKKDLQFFVDLYNRL